MVQQVDELDVLLVDEFVLSLLVIVVSSLSLSNLNSINFLCLVDHLLVYFVVWHG